MLTVFCTLGFIHFASMYQFFVIKGFVASFKKPSVFVIFRWSSDGQYVARAGHDMLSVYESPVFGLLDKKSIKVTGIKDFSWSPSQNVIAYWVPEEGDAPARVCIMELPSREEIRVKNLFNVHDVSSTCMTGII